MGQRGGVLGALAALVVLAGCGGNGGGLPRATLLLDFTPNAVHAGIYSAVARGYDRQAGVRLRIEQPSASTDSVKFLVAGRADFAVLDIHDLGLAREKGRDLVGLLALVQRPLAAVIAQPGIRSPRDLEGRRAGVTGLPSDEAVLRSVVSGSGGDPSRVRQVTIGFNAVQGLLANRIDAATAFWDVEGVALQRRRPGFRIFRVDDYGAPAYPELVLCATRQTVERRPALVRHVVNALVRGYVLTLTRPAASLHDLLARNPGLDRSLTAAELRAVRPAFTNGGAFGRLVPARLRAWAAWDRRFGILPQPLNVRRAFPPVVHPEYVVVR